MSDRGDYRRDNLLALRGTAPSLKRRRLDSDLGDDRHASTKSSRLSSVRDKTVPREPFHKPSSLRTGPADRSDGVSGLSIQEIRGRNQDLYRLQAYSDLPRAVAAIHASIKKAPPKLPQAFICAFCGRTDTVSINTHNKDDSGGLLCSSCQQERLTRVNHRRNYRVCQPCRARKMKCDLGDIDKLSPGPCALCARESKQCWFDDAREQGADTAAVHVGELFSEAKRIHTVKDRRANLKTTTISITSHLFPDPGNRMFKNGLRERLKDGEGYVWLKGIPGAGKSTVIGSAQSYLAAVEAQERRPRREHEASKAEPIRNVKPGPKVRYDTISQDRSGGERQILLCALGNKTMSLNATSSPRSGEVRRLKSSGYTWRSGMGLAP